MNKDTVEGSMKEFTGTIKAQWGKLTDSDCMEAKGNLEVLSGKLQKAYGKTKEEADREIKEFKKAHPSKCGCS
jgi:uncharacterized protein YjbJ (UPF0337 family)